MPRQIAATLIKAVARSTVMDDGKHMMLVLIGDEDEEIKLAIPHDQILHLADLAARSFSDSSKVLGLTDVDLKSARAVSQWDLRYDDAADNFILSLTFGAGGTLSFRLSQAHAQEISDKLKASVSDGRLKRIGSSP